jgi:hypothetical protein
MDMFCPLFILTLTATAKQSFKQGLFLVLYYRALLIPG